MDMTFHDDACRIRTNNAPENFVTLKHMAANLGRKSRPKEKGQGFPPPSPQNRSLGRRLPRRPHQKVKYLTRLPCTVAADQGVITHIARQRIIAGSAIENLIGKASLMGTCFCACDAAMRGKARLGVTIGRDHGSS
jgi:hypothetical protein